MGTFNPDYRKLGELIVLGNYTILPTDFHTVDIRAGNTTVILPATDQEGKVRFIVNNTSLPTVNLSNANTKLPSANNPVHAGEIAECVFMLGKWYVLSGV